MTDPNDDIIHQIKNALRNHEEPYNEGAWERFAASSHVVRRPKRATLWLWTAAAAAAIFAGILLFNRLGNEGLEKPIASKGEVPATETTLPPASAPQTGTTSEVAQSETSDRTNIIMKHDAPPAWTPSHRPVASTGNEQLIAKMPIPAIVNGGVTVATSLPNTNGIAKNDATAPPKVDFWNSPVVNGAPSDNKKVTVANPQQRPSLVAANTASAPDRRSHEKEKTRKWQPSLYVSPLFDELGVNMGYGVSLGYAINDKIKISSGIAHTRISASRAFGDNEAATSGFNNVAADAPISGAAGASGAGELTGAKNSLITYSSVAPNTFQSTQVLQQIEGYVSGVDIPLEVNYNINRKFYATAGVSALVVINDNKTYTYTDNHNVKISVETSKGTPKEDKIVSFNELNTTDHAPTPSSSEHTPLLGFYNMSVGYRQKISDKNAISLEPFVKVPMNTGGQQSLKYTGAGLRLKFDL
ncbi:hypothetical protein ABDK00_011985 [Niabella insulamsoli]|uniref:hypothetical protein n=1 Tax=Niabella insulamsoli TaxID=3144874 RepID=UPI0031FBCDC7